MSGWWRRRSLRLRLTIVSSLVLALGLTVGVLGLSALFARARVAELDRQLTAEASTVAGLVSSGQLTQPLPVPPGSPVLAQVVDSAGTVLASTPSAGRVLPLVPSASLASLAGQPASTVDETGYGAGQVRVLVVPTTMAGTPVSVVSTVSVADLDSTLDQLRRVLLVVTPLTVLAAALASWFALGAALRPVDEMRAAAEADRELPVPPADDELARLATTLNHMLDRLRSAAQQQRDFASDAAHELRTPLTTLITGLDVARAGGPATDWDVAGERAVAQARRLNALIEDLLLLARTDADRLVRSEPVDLTALVLESGAARADVPDEPVVVLGDQSALERMLANLLDNARRHARSSVTTRLVASEGVAVLTVTDDGPGVPADQLDAIFTRFHRVDASRARQDGGAGLGLAIVRGVARTHGGDATAEQASGGGLTVRVTIAGVQRSLDRLDQGAR